MSTEVDQASGHIQTSVSTLPSSASTSSSKMSMLSKKSGFVIPKNKLSGSLVPVLRGGKKEDSDTTNGESTKLVQRKTKWGTDLSLDAAVRKGRALAYQTRVDQITGQLSVGISEAEENEQPISAAEVQEQKDYKPQLLEHERREAIGEILKLNPGYKAPADYKPLVKEAKVPIPIKEYPGYNFISLVFGPASDTQKRLEKETGAKIRIYGTKADTRGKAEVTATERNESGGAYEELYVHISADTYEKVDAAVSLIELLVTPVPANPGRVLASPTTVSSDRLNNSNVSQGMPSSFMPPPPFHHVVVQPNVAPVPAPPQGQFLQHPQPWFPLGASQAPAPSLVTSASPPPPFLQGSGVSPSNMPSLFGPVPVTAASFHSTPQNPSLVTSSPQQSHVLQSPYMPQTHDPGPSGIPRNPPMPMLQSNAQPIPTGPPQFARPAITPLPQSGPPAAFSSMPFPSPGEPNRWLQSSRASTPQVTANMNPVVPQITPLQGHSVASPQMVASGAPPVNPSANIMMTSVPQPSPPQSQMGFARIPAPVSAPMPMQPALSQSPFTPPNLLPGSTLIQRPPRPHLGDFTFQPHHPQNPAPQLAPRISSQSSPQDFAVPNHLVHPPLAPQSPLFRPAFRNMNPPVQGPPIRHQINQPGDQVPMRTSGNPAMHPSLNAHSVFPSPSAVSPTIPQLPPRNFVPAHPSVNTAFHVHTRAGNPMQSQQNYPPGATHPHRLVAPHQHFSDNRANRAPSSLGTQQVYDPFSPAVRNHFMGGNTARAQNESDPEYEDLMASVGVK